MKTRFLLVSIVALILNPMGYCNYPGDCNGDRVVDDFDFNLIITNFGNNYLPVNGPGDCWQDGVVDDFDFNMVITNFGADYRYITSGEMVYIPAGSFLMGNSNLSDDAVYRLSDELPQHLVYLSGYWIGKYEVTRGEYKQFMDAGGYTNSIYWSTDGWGWKVVNNRILPDYWAAQQNFFGSPPFTQTDYYPVWGVTYYEAEAYCNWAGGHLPTEAQWEKSARWKSTTNHPNVYPWGDTWEPEKCNNYHGNLYPNYQTAPVGIYPQGVSPYGCHDMAGNVLEWCKDWYSATYYAFSPTNDPQGPSSGIERVVRGGGWYFYVDVNHFRVANRSYRYDPTVGRNDVGFRLARD